MDERLLWHVLRQGARCIVCGEPLFADKVPPKWGGVTREHKIPKSLGGSDSMDNIGASHVECNRSRGNRLNLRRLRPDRGTNQPQGKNWRARLLATTSSGAWWTQRKIEMKPIKGRIVIPIKTTAHSAVAAPE